MSKNLTKTHLIDLILNLVSRQVHVPKENIDVQFPLANYGIDSIHALSLCAELEESLAIEIDPVIAWDYPSITLMAEFLESKVAQASR